MMFLSKMPPPRLIFWELIRKVVPTSTRRFTVNDATTRIESIGHAEGAKRKINVIVRNRTGKPALLERTEEIIP